jgi:hypothetical protein
VVCDGCDYYDLLFARVFIFRQGENMGEKEIKSSGRYVDYRE